MRTIKLQNKLNIILSLLITLFLQSCANFQKANMMVKNNQKLATLKIKSSLPSHFENFDKKSYPNESYIIANMISVVQPELDAELRATFANYISKAMKTYNLEPQIIVAIIDTESNFKADKVSNTGDLSLAQINVEVWNKEFIRMKIKPMIKEKIKTNQQYALMKMGKILSIIRSRYGKNDRHWYARYHSNTLKFKKDYLYKLEIRLKQIAISKFINNNIARNN